MFKNENLGRSYFDSNIIYRALVIEYIDNDLDNNILSEIKILYMESTFIYDKTIEDFLKIELEKIKKLKIKPVDSDSSRHILWNSKKKKYYFIDVGMWKIPLKYYLKYMFI